MPTRALRRAIGLLLVLLILGTVLGRLDLVALAVPFGLGTALAMVRRPRRLPTVELDVPDGIGVEGAGLTGRVVVTNPDPAHLSTVSVHTRRSRWLRFTSDTGTLVTPVHGHSDVEVPLEGRALRWGRQQVGPVEVRAHACDGLLRSRLIRAGVRRLRVYPTTQPFEASDAMPRAAGVAGTHRSRRPGEGGELAGVRPYQPGDRLRRVDWRVSLRTRELYVDATLSERDAEVVLVLDVLHEAGTSGGVGVPKVPTPSTRDARDPGPPSASVLDTTVRATAGIAEHYLHRGDRVSAVEFGPALRHLRAGTGHRHYLATLEWLLDVRVIPAGAAPGSRLLSHRVLPPNALVLFLTPLLDERSATMLAQLARSGRFVLAVDTLPDTARPPRASQWTDLAYRLWRLDRQNLIGRLREVGVPVVTWAGAGSLDEVLRDVTRMAAAPRAVSR